MKSPTVMYFGEQTIAAAIEDYFMQHGLTEEVRDDLMLMSIKSPEDFFDIVDEFVMRNENIS